jgi:hypothetical protein
MIRAVTAIYFGEALVYGKPLAKRPRGHVAVDKRVGQLVAFLRKLSSQLVRESTFLGFEDRTRMVGHEATESGVGVLDVPEVPGAIEGMKAGRDKAWGVADVM